MYTCNLVIYNNTENFSNNNDGTWFTDVTYSYTGLRLVEGSKDMGSKSLQHWPSLWSWAHSKRMTLSPVHTPPWKHFTHFSKTPFVKDNNIPVCKILPSIVTDCNKWGWHHPIQTPIQCAGWSITWPRLNLTSHVSPHQGGNLLGGIGVLFAMWEDSIPCPPSSMVWGLHDSPDYSESSVPYSSATWGILRGDSQFGFILRMGNRKGYISHRCSFPSYQLPYNMLKIMPS